MRIILKARLAPDINVSRSFDIIPFCVRTSHVSDWITEAAKISERITVMAEHFPDIEQERLFIPYGKLSILCLFTATFNYAYKYTADGSSPARACIRAYRDMHLDWHRKTMATKSFRNILIRAVGFARSSLVASNEVEYNL